MTSSRRTLRLSAADGNCALLTRGVHEFTVKTLARCRSVSVHALTLNKKNAGERSELQGGFRGGC